MLHSLALLIAPLQAGAAPQLVRHTGSEGIWLPTWAALLSRFGPLLLLAIYFGLVLRALLHHRRYDALTVLDADARTAVGAAVKEAERRTDGEIVPVVLERSDRHPQACWLAAFVTLLVGSALLASWLPWEEPALLLLGQCALGAAGWWMAWLLPDLKRGFIRETRASEVAEEQAVQEFHRMGLHRTKAATGVLLFVSLLERRVIVLGDTGIHQRVGDSHWAATTQAVLDGIAAGSLRDGLLAGVDRCGAVLAEHFPATRHDRNELPDRLIVRRE